MNRFMLYLIGAVIGGFTGYKIAENIIEKEEEWDDSEIFPSESDWEKMEDIDEVEELPVGPKSILDLGTIEVVDDESDGDPVIPRKRHKTRRNTVDYTKFVERNGTKPPLSVVLKERIGEGSEAEIDETPTIISSDDYLGRDARYSQEILVFYQVDGVLADGDDKRIMNPDELIGDALLHFGEQSNDPDEVYVRNPVKGVEYEVIRIPKSYQDTVVGPVMPPKRAKRASNGEQAQ